MSDKNTKTNKSITRNLDIKILDFLKNSNGPNSVKDILIYLDNTYNKTSVYRRLEKLLNTGSLKKIESDSKSLYEINKTMHAHFKCNKCHNISCIDIENNLSFNIKGKILDIDINIKGICTECLE